MKTPAEIHFDKVAKDYDYYKRKNSFYYSNLKELLGNLIPKHKKVFEIGCGTGDLLNYLKPSHGYGMDISDKMIAIAKHKYLNSRNLKFSTQWPKEEFDYIFMSDVVEHLENPKYTFIKIRGLMGEKTVFVNTMANPFWEPVLMIAEKLGLKMPEGPHIRLTTNNLKLIINNSKLKIIKHNYRLLMPIHIPIVTDLINKGIEKYSKKFAFISYFKRFSFIEYFVIKK